MENIKVRLITITIILFVFSILELRVSYSEYAHGRNKNVFENFPLKIDGWDGFKVPFNENVYKILETDAVVVNRYVSGNNVVNLSMVYYPEVKVDFHSPEGCNTGTGDRIQNLAKKEITFTDNNNIIKFYVNAFIVYSISGNKRIYYYMYKSGDSIGNSYIKLRLKMAKAYFMERRTSGALIVYSAPVYRSVEDSEKIIYEFIKSSYPTINKFI